MAPSTAPTVSTTLDLDVDCGLDDGCKVVVVVRDEVEDDRDEVEDDTAEGVLSSTLQINEP